MGSTLDPAGGVEISGFVRGCRGAADMEHDPHGPRKAGLPE